MVLILALLEVSSLFAVVCGTIFLWATPILIDWIDVATVLGQACAVSLCYIISFYYNGLYDLRKVWSFGEFVSRLLQSFGLAFILLSALYTLFPETRITGGTFLWSLLIIVGFLLSFRAVWYDIIRRRLFANRVLILGTSPLAHTIIEEIEAQPHFRYTVVSHANDAVALSGSGFRSPLLGPLDHLDKIIEEVQPDRIVTALAERRGRLPVRQLMESQARGIVVEEGLDVYERLTGKLAIELLTPASLIFSEDFRKSRLELALGRAVSLIASLPGLVILALLLGPIALAIKLDSRGPVFFIHPRMGLYGKRFNVIKFRTMHPVTGERSEWVAGNGDRITRVGKWLRIFRLDEFPQFINILRGDMNLVGPRPHPVSNHELFLKHIPYYSLRSMVRPGITGWAQIRHGYANNLEEETEKMRYDLYYIKHMSLWFDLRILLETIKIVLLGRGAKVADAYWAKSHIEGADNHRPNDDQLNRTEVRLKA
jgi:exopolysaccharide biosynthesis polyprenyl glycosylphosphotransferase